MEFTGERIIPEHMKITNGMLLEHLARYHFAIHYAKGRVLDFACGTGYGSNIAAKAKKKVIDEIIAVDIDPETIQYAKQHYYHPSVRYITGDVTDPTLPSSLGQFDVIMSFETLEHVSQENEFMDNLYDLLKPGGTLIVSTPFGSGRGKPTNEPFHVHQLTEDEFKGLFKGYKNTDFYYQKGVLIEPKRKGIHYPIGIAVCEK
ncbi:class I SAM-dependent methyltransferase [Falsibacillus albus]|uniref:Class I SAM-dependent methyltransferase n=1 Tax=Falsibacillus albus TaxID=2478915 RepID=A0A3L7JXG2_9BACI|nr:class I SAM-dependent methyltransferase [Falsibacillus albus]RLQ95210.1 class I SAM-dependent methyltransferase [Falsibacillus albus]